MDMYSLQEFNLQWNICIICVSQIQENLGGRYKLLAD